MRIELSTKNTFETDGPNAIHADSIQKLLRKGAMHLSNEIASGVQGRIERDERSGIVRKSKKDGVEVEGDSGDVKKAKLAAFREAYPDVVNSWFDEAEAKLIAELVSGAYAAEREAGQTKRLSELESVVRDLAKVELEAQLGRKPKLADTITVNGVDMTYENLIERYVGSEKHKARLEKDAQKQIDQRKARAERAKSGGTIEF